MKLYDQLGLARRSLTRHPLRTMLTMLGMIIGVASIIAMTSIGLGARHQVQVEIERLGTNLLTVNPIARTTDSLRSSSDGGHRLTEGDGTVLSNEIAEVSHVVPVVNGNVRLVSGNNNWKTLVIGTHPDYVAARDWQTSQGRNFTLREVAGAEKVLLIGRTVEKKLSPLQPLLGKVVRVNDVPFRVIGVLAEKGHLAMGRDQDDLIVAPITSVRSRLLGGYYRDKRDAVAYLLIKGSHPDRLDNLRASIERVLRARHGTRPGAASDFRVRDPMAALSASKSTSETLTLLLACIAAVSLLVGGISIMNIMLVSVAERTREIGVRIAVGATQGDVRRQFLAESAGVALFGGTIGVAVGAATALLISLTMGWKVLIDVWVCLGALSFSALVGLLSGLYPAFMASRLDPMDAIRQQ
jgi:putative ABC transport system permease protein